MAGITDKLRDLLSKKTFVHLATVMPDGSPQVSAVWVTVDGDHILINSAEGRLKDTNIRRDPRVALSATDPANPYYCAMVRGRVVDITTDGADDDIDRLAKKYLDEDKYPYRREDEVRVTYRIVVERVSFTR